MLKAAIISLGCPRNLVDSEVIVGSLKKGGFKVVGDAEKGSDVCIINTCSFIESAREESISAILEAAALKKTGKIKRLIVCGCLPQLHKEKLLKDIPEIDLAIGTNDFAGIKDLVKAIRLKTRRAVISRDLSYLYDENSPRFVLTPRHYAYVKISEGCNNFCSYCIITRLRGSFRSRPIGSVVNEVAKLAGRNDLKEINLIGQDTTLFGMDRYGKPMIAELLRRICRIKNAPEWIRLLYTHPAHYTDELIYTVRDEKNICKYLDLPIQHISDKILKKMNRRTTKKEIAGLIERIRKNIPGVGIRTSIIVGFPGETDKDFKELIAFVKSARFERLGAFLYSREEGTSASRYEGQVPEELKRERFDELMRLQQGISARTNEKFFGKKIKVLIDEKSDSADEFIGRTQTDAPEVDGSVFVNGKNIKIGEFCTVKITDTLEYDLAGRAS